MFYQDHRPGEWSCKALGGIADGQVITGRDGHATYTRYDPVKPGVNLDDPGPLMATGKRSDYMLMTMKVVVPGQPWEERFTVWVEYSLVNKPIVLLWMLFQCYNPVRGRFERD